ncbi:c-type cytochrome biogenesis protein CcsB [Nocardioides sp. IC4_145]|uniref:c-type cytochrome biogenesis protein CcsB n=1 Tax=Nocardioides sp. IC4_145 TaxID=2714037 RepID=UPI00140CE9D4|nr:c-type cytochrome biogenesis protein CcsB [Nocardioides sp. IC4_145]NHC22941.1 c-type cytochrome biogenesis protein CcsB [Nocardioides sp. IC4_145]
MISAADLARLSDALVTAALAAFGIALVAFAVSSALARHRPALKPTGAAAHPELPLTAQHSLGAPTGSPHAARVERTATVILAFATGVLVAAVVCRGFAAQRVPWGNMYEFGLTGSATVAVVLVSSLRRRAVMQVAAWVVALILILLGVSVTSLYTPVDELVPVLKSRWLVVHVAAAIVAGALFCVGAVTTVAQLVRDSNWRRRSAEVDASDAHAQDSLAEFASTVHLVAFPIWTFAVIAGAVWAENAWGRYWGWDPKETWAFITWVFYAAHLHALSTAKWRRRSGYLALAGFAAFLFNFFGVNMWIPGLHSYAGV